MICFSLEVNGRRLALAGIPGFAVLSAGLTWVRRKPRGSTKLPDEELDVSLSGLDSNSETDDGSHLWWVNRKVAVGDRIVFEVVESDVSDPPERRSPQYTAEELEKERARSARAYLKAYKRQQAATARRIRELEKAIAAEKTKKSAARKVKRR
jgi:hypothetical protein